MKDSWTRSIAAIELAPDQVSALVQAVWPAARVRASVQLAGGLGNTNLRVTLSGAPYADVVLRLYQRDPRERHKEVALARLVAGQVPVPAFLHHADGHASYPAPYAILTWIEGRRLAAEGDMPSNWRQVARIADLYAWAEFLRRHAVGDALIADARRVIAATITRG